MKEKIFVLKRGLYTKYAAIYLYYIACTISIGHPLLTVIRYSAVKLFSSSTIQCYTL